ncbi:phosphohydrolase [Spirochaetia bacterium]|nr:phosphohydrolase [Spirochaetia bacterium]GHU34280.1 phosphohydrolase [Spirochaetia bacterium]
MLYSIADIPAESFFSKPVYLDKDFVLLSPEIHFDSDMVKALTDWEFRVIFSEGEPRKDYIPEHPQAAAGTDTVRDRDKLRAAQHFCAEFRTYVTELFDSVATVPPTLDRISKWVQAHLDSIRENRRFLLRVIHEEIEDEESFLAMHTVHSTIIAIVIGLYLKLPNHRLIELGVISIVHEIGMTKLPSQVYMNDRTLSPAERKAVMAHPILGYNILKSAGFPMAACLAVLEHHERENGSGYPRQIIGDKISYYAKIIAVACSYDGSTSERPYRETADAFTGMVNLLKNEGKPYDDAVIRALVFSLSLYPIGLYVLLSTGKKAQVVDVNPENPRFPVVQIFGELNPDGKNKEVGTSPDGISITRPLTKEEIDEID